MWNNQNSHSLLWNGVTTLENSLEVSYIVKSTPTWSSSNSIVRHFPNRNKDEIAIKNLHNNVHRLFLWAPTCEQPKCFLAGKWIRKWWYIHTPECYSVVERNEFLTHVITWMNLKCVQHFGGEDKRLTLWDEGARSWHV